MTRMCATGEIHLVHGKECHQCLAMMITEENQTIDLQKLSNKTWARPHDLSCQWQSHGLEVDIASVDGVSDSLQLMEDQIPS